MLGHGPGQGRGWTPWRSGPGPCWESQAVGLVPGSPGRVSVHLFIPSFIHWMALIRPGPTLRGCLPHWGTRA